MAQFAVDWFGVVAPGRPVVSNFVMVDSAKCTALVERPADIGELCFFLLPRCQLPPATCAVLYFSADDSAWTVLGSLSAEKPSGIFRLPPHLGAGAAVARVGVALEPAATAANLDLVGSGASDRLCGIQIFNPTSMCAYATVSTQAFQMCFENSTRAIDSSKNQPNRLRFDRAREF